MLCLRFFFDLVLHFVVLFPLEYQCSFDLMRCFVPLMSSVCPYDILTDFILMFIFQGVSKYPMCVVPHCIGLRSLRVWIFLLNSVNFMLLFLFL